MRTISDRDDVIDSRDVIARIEALQDEQRDYTHDADGNQNSLVWADDYPGDAAELEALLALAEECEGYSDWRHGETLIRDSYFETYARQLAEDCGLLKNTDTWPGRCIDWERAATELQQDYTSAEYGDVTYWIRCS